MNPIRKRLLIPAILILFIFFLPILTIIIGQTTATENPVNVTLPKYLLTIVVYPNMYSGDQRPLVKIGITTPNDPNTFGNPIGDQCIWYGFTQPDPIFGNSIQSVSIVLPRGEYIVWVAYDAQLVNLNQTRTIVFANP
jgi:hypothetical protein